MESALSACFLLLWTLSASDRVKAASDFEVTDDEYEIKLRCSNGSTLMKLNEKGKPVTDTLDYDDSSSGEYQCGSDGAKIFVKFHTCNNCIEADAPAIAGMIVGNVVATLVIGVAVYLVASQIPGDGRKGHAPPGSPAAAAGFSPRGAAASNGAMSPTDDHYQPLQAHQKGLYDRLQGNRGHSTPR